MVDHFPYSGGEETLSRGATARLCKGRPLEAQLQGRREGVRTPSPSLFCSAPHPPGPSHPLQARGERDPRLPPRPATPRRVALPRIVPRGWGEEAARPRPAPPHPPRRRKAPRGPPVRSPSGSRPRRRPPPPRQKRRGQSGGPAYRDMRNALLALVRHGPPLAPSARPVDLWGWLSPCLAVSRSRSPRAR